MYSSSTASYCSLNYLGDIFRKLCRFQFGNWLCFRGCVIVHHLQIYTPTIFFSSQQNVDLLLDCKLFLYCPTQNGICTSAKMY